MTFLKTTICAISRSINTSKDTKKPVPAATAGRPLVLSFYCSPCSGLPSPSHVAVPGGSPYSLMDCDLQGGLRLLKPESPVFLRPLSASRPGEGPEALPTPLLTTLHATFYHLGIGGTGRRFGVELYLGMSSSGLPTFTTEMSSNFHTRKTYLNHIRLHNFFQVRKAMNLPSFDFSLSNYFHNWKP